MKITGTNRLIINGILLVLIIIFPLKTGECMKSKTLPERALKQVTPDQVLPIDEIGYYLNRLGGA